MTDGSYNNAKAGFTLVEVLVVLAITSVVFGLSVFSISTLKNRVSPDALGKQIVGLFADVRERAISSGQPLTALIDMREKTIGSEFGDAIRIPENFKLVVTVGQETVSNSAQLQVYFLPDGTSSGVNIDISRPGREPARIETNWLTGLSRQVNALD